MNSKHRDVTPILGRGTTGGGGSITYLGIYWDIILTFFLMARDDLSNNQSIISYLMTFESILCFWTVIAGVDIWERIITV